MVLLIEEALGNDFEVIHTSSWGIAIKHYNYVTKHIIHKLIVILNISYYRYSSLQLNSSHQSRLHRQYRHLALRYLVICLDIKR